MQYEIVLTNNFKKQLKIIKRRSKDLKKLSNVVDLLASSKVLDSKYKDHQLVNNERFKDCRECHIEPDWLLIYKKNNNDLILFLMETGSHSDLF